MKSEKCKFGSAIIATVVILAALVFVFAAGSASAKTWYVDDDGGQDFKRIQAAVVAASDGDTIYVYEGYYNEIVTLDKELIVIGENKTTTIIDGNNIKDVVKITANNCSLTGFTMNNSGSDYAGVKIYEGKNANVSGNKIEGNQYGVFIDHGSCVNRTGGALVVGNSISSSGSFYGYAVYISSSNDNVVSGNDISSSCTTTHAVYLASSNSNTISNNVMYSSGRDRFGVYMDSSNYNSVSNNNISSYTGWCGAYGIYLLSSSSHNTVANNSILNCDGGILLWSSSDNNDITGNDIVSDGDEEGIYLLSSHQNTIRNNNASNCGNYGIYTSGSNDNVIIDNTVSFNNLDGIYLENSDLNTISGNDLSENNRYGIYLYSTGNNENTITNNKIVSNKEDGIYIQSSDNTISGNNIHGNKGDGIDLASINNIEISNNTIASNTWYGIKLNAVTDSQIFENNLSDNFYGVGLDGCSNNKIWHNNFLANIDNAYDDASTNRWYKGPVSGGNYWSDHTCHGNPSDGGEPYEIDEDSVDHYPFENVSGWVLTMPAVSIRTDKTEYSPGDTMNITLGFYNPASSPVNTYFIWHFGLPDYGYQKPVMSTPLTLPADFELLHNVSIPIGDLGDYGFNAIWYVALLETTPPYETISEDSVNWSYVPAGKGIGKVKPTEIGEEIVKKVEGVELPC